MIAHFPTNAEIMADRIEKFNALEGARVGDYVRLPRRHQHHGEFTRITHDWGDTLQTGGMGGSFYLGAGWLSYSGSLDSGIARAQLVATDETRIGPFWFFDEDRSGAGRGISFEAPMRVFTVREGADLSGLGELRCPFSLCCINETQHRNTCGYWYLIYNHAMNHTAFATVEELAAWLSKNDLVLASPLPAERGTFAAIDLLYTEGAR